MVMLFDISNNVTTIIAASLVFLGTVFTGVMSYLNLKKATKIEKNTDGLVSTLIAGKDETAQAKQALSKAEGKAEGIAQKQPEIDKLNKDSKPEK